MNKEILKLAIPNVLSNLSIPLLGIVDTWLMGTQETPIYLGAVTIAGVIFSFIYWGFGFLRMGTTGITAQAFGAENKTKLSNTLLRASLVAIISGLLIIMLQVPIDKLGFWFIDAEKELSAIASEYFYIRIWGAPAAILIFALNGWFLGMQNASFPMIITIFLNVGNLLFNYYFVKIMGMKADGVAYGTLIAQYLTVFLAIILLLIKYKSFLTKIKWKEIFRIDEITEFFNVNKDIFIRTIFLILTYAFFNIKSEDEGLIILAVNAIFLQYLYILSYGIDGFAYAVESLAGKYFGKRNQSDLNKAVRYSFYWGIGLAAVYSIVFFLIRNDMIAFFTNDQTVIDASLPYVWWLIIMPIPNAIAFVWDGVYIGLTASKPMRNNMIIATVIFFIPIYYLLHPYIGNHALWLSMTLFMIVRSVGLSIQSPKYLKIKTAYHK